MDYYLLDISHCPVKVEFEEFKKLCDRMKCVIHITNNIIAFFNAHTIDNDGILETKYLCGAFIIIN